MFLLKQEFGILPMRAYQFRYYHYPKLATDFLTTCLSPDSIYILPWLSRSNSFLLNDIPGKQQWYGEYHEKGGARRIPFIGQFTRSDNGEIIAAAIGKTLDIGNKMREESPAAERVPGVATPLPLLRISSRV